MFISNKRRLEIQTIIPKHSIDDKESLAEWILVAKPAKNI